MAEKHITLRNGTTLFYASGKTVQGELRNKGNNLAADKLNGASDLEAGVYEGGFKIWECAVDLCNFLCDIELAGLDILELGCGAALPSIFAISKGAASVCVQDFNDFVLDAFTKTNFELNGAQMDKCTFVGGEWNNKALLEQIGPRRFGLVLASETIYNESNYKPFLDVIDTLLDPQGKVLLAAKCYYFGVGGSIPSFVEFVRAQGTFANIEEVWSTKTSSVPRKILLLSRK